MDSDNYFNTYGQGYSEKQKNEYSTYFWTKILPCLSSSWEKEHNQGYPSDWISTETNPEYKQLDQVECVDLIQKTPKGLSDEIRYSIRIQPIEPSEVAKVTLKNKVHYVKSNPFNTFSVRKCRIFGDEDNTEWEKLVRLYKQGRLTYGHYTFQLYCDKKTGKPISLAWIKTYDLVSYALTFNNQNRPSRNSASAEFYIFGWEYLQNEGYKISVINLNR